MSDPKGKKLLVELLEKLKAARVRHGGTLMLMDLKEPSSSFRMAQDEELVCVMGLDVYSTLMLHLPREEVVQLFQPIGSALPERVLGIELVLDYHNKTRCDFFKR